MKNFSSSFLNMRMRGYGLGFVSQKVAGESEINTYAGAGEWKYICSGGLGFHLAISDSGALFAFGEANEYGQSGCTDPTVQLGQPRKMCLPGVTTIKQAVAGPTYSLAVTDKGKVFQWGFFPTEQHVSKEYKQHEDTVQIRELNPQPPAVDTSCNTRYLSEAGESDREERFSECGPHSGNVPAVKLLLDPTVIVTAVAAGDGHCLALTGDGSLLTFGWGLYGQLGHGSTDNQHTPRQVAALGGIQVADVALGRWHSVCCSGDGAVYSWGGNQAGQLGNGGTACQVLPLLVESPVIDSEVVVEVGCGNRHTIVRSEDGKVFGWGWNRFEQLGNVGGGEDELLPIECLPRSKAIACGSWHTLTLSS